MSEYSSRNTEDKVRPRIRPIHTIQKITTQYVWLAWVLVLIMLVVGLGLGIWGFSMSERLIESETDAVDISDAVYSTVKLLKLGDHSNDPAPNIQVRLARFILPLTVSMAAILGLFTFLRSCYHRLRSYRFRNHTIICGLGDRGISYIKDAVNGYVTRERDTLDIIVIEKNPDNPGVKFCNEEGIPVFIGDATKKDVLSLARPWTAREIFAFVPEDGQNLALANTLAEIYDSMDVKRDEKLKCYLSISSVELQNQFIDREFTFRKDNEKLDLALDIDFCYSREYMTERSLVKGVRNLIVRGIDSGIFESNETPEIVIIGAGYIGRKIIANISRLFHLKNEVRIQDGKVEYHAPVKLTIYDKDKDAAINLYKEYPILERTSKYEDTEVPLSANDELHNLQINLEKGENIHRLPLPEIVFKTMDLELPRVIAKIAYDIYSSPNAKSVVVALGDDSLSVSIALQLERIFETYVAAGKTGSVPQISVYYQKYGGFDTIFGKGRNNFLQIEYLKKNLTSEDTENPTKITPFCNWASISFDKDVSYDKVDKIAVGVEACYNRHNTQTEIPDEQSSIKDLNQSEFEMARISFENRPVLQINQNRNQVLHNQIKLNLVDYSIIKEGKEIPEGFELIDDWDEINSAICTNVEVLCRLEHQRWWAEQLLNGGRYNKTRDNSLELHPDMVPYEYIHDVSPEEFGKLHISQNRSITQKYDYYAVMDIPVTFKYAGYLPIKKKSDK